MVLAVNLSHAAYNRQHHVNAKICAGHHPMLLSSGIMGKTPLGGPPDHGDIFTFARLFCGAFFPPILGWIKNFQWDENDIVFIAPDQRADHACLNMIGHGYSTVAARLADNIPEELTSYAPPRTYQDDGKPPAASNDTTRGVNGRTGAVEAFLYER